MATRESKTDWAQLPESILDQLDADLCAAYRRFGDIVAQRPLDDDFFVAVARLHGALEHTLLQLTALQSVLQDSK